MRMSPTCLDIIYPLRNGKIRISRHLDHSTAQHSAALFTHNKLSACKTDMEYLDVNGDAKNSYTQKL